MSHKCNYIISCFVFAFLELLTRLEIFLQTSYNYVFCILYICDIVTYLVGSWVVVWGIFFNSHLFFSAIEKKYYIHMIENWNNLKTIKKIKTTVILHIRGVSLIGLMSLKMAACSKECLYVYN